MSLLAVDTAVRCVQFSLAVQNDDAGGSRAVTTMSFRRRVHSLDRYSDRRDDDGEQRGGGTGVSSSGGGRRSARTPSSAVDGWTSDNDVTDSAWQRTVQSSSSTDRGQLTPFYRTQ